ncbi:hypothetical protein BK133_02770 [Paenibacillus sp. FSL H8-0548]|uniref:IS66 family transposase n=1 Tax=Paenibacillus sp. FSL H8-0548 TaxID=1920422 RepID=UPI00096F3C27|nr:hypothetical protein [Paenibacillus sp. FSL H8-0548]OMF38458.1 hypothetical protein BK133_02770 [Paenibacillus sp. FSL H8-0548]
MENRAEIQTPTIENNKVKVEQLEQQVAELTAKLHWYEEQFRLAQQKRFGASSEKTHPDQLEMNLFNEAEVLARSTSEEPDMETVIYSRKKSAGTHEAKWDGFPIKSSRIHCSKKSKYAPAVAVTA